MALDSVIADFFNLLHANTRNTKLFLELDDQNYVNASIPKEFIIPLLVVD